VNISTKLTPWCGALLAFLIPAYSRSNSARSVTLFVPTYNCGPAFTKSSDHSARPIRQPECRRDGKLRESRSWSGKRYCGIAVDQYMLWCPQYRCVDSHRFLSGDDMAALEISMTPAACTEPDRVFESKQATFTGEPSHLYADQPPSRLFRVHLRGQWSCTRFINLVPLVQVGNQLEQESVDTFPAACAFRCRSPTFAALDFATHINFRSRIVTHQHHCQARTDPSSVIVLFRRLPQPEFRRDLVAIEDCGRHEPAFLGFVSARNSTGTVSLFDSF